MKPDATRVLEHTAVSLMTDIGPAVAPAYRQSSVTALGALLLCAREEFDRAAARRVDENAALRGLFARASAVVADADLAGELEREAGSGDPDLSIPALEAHNQALRRLLIRLHAHIEAAQGEAARAIETEIWQELARSTERRRLAMSVF